MLHLHLADCKVDVQLTNISFAADRTASPCTSAYNASLEMLRQNPLLQDGPDFPECDSNGLYRSRQCNDMTGVCWCVDPVTGIMLDGTLGRESCEGEAFSSIQTANSFYSDGCSLIN